MLRRLYSIFFYLALPWVVLRAFYKTRRNKKYMNRFKERFGYIDQTVAPGGIWLHAVSVGEVIASIPLVKQLQKQYPHLPITITTMTPTGAERVKAAYDDTVTHIYVPYDFPLAIKRFLNKVQPSLVLIMETEIWPNFLYYCHARKIPVLLTNARLSEKSANGYARIARLTRDMLRQINIIAAQTEDDAKRFLTIGADTSQIRVTGSIKFDITIAASMYEKAHVFRERFGSNRLVFVAASTHEGEEEKILEVFQQLREQFPALLLVLVPRHPERFAKVASLCKKHGLNIILRSSNDQCTLSTQVVIGDSMGELCAYYAASDVAFVGGSLMPVGGHNLLEPAALGIPAVTGPYVFNFTEITRLLTEAGGAVKIETLDELKDALALWLADGAKRSLAGQTALQVVQQNKGALNTHLQLIDGLLTKKVA